MTSPTLCLPLFRPSLSNIKWISFTIIIISHYVYSLPRPPRQPPSPLFQPFLPFAVNFHRLCPCFSPSKTNIFFPLVPHNSVHFPQNLQDWYHHLPFWSRFFFFLKEGDVAWCSLTSSFSHVSPSGMGDCHRPPDLTGQTQYFWRRAVQRAQGVALLLLRHIRPLCGRQVSRHLQFMLNSVLGEHTKPLQIKWKKPMLTLWAFVIVLLLKNLQLLQLPPGSRKSLSSI